jgi:hypothetical protein
MLLVEMLLGRRALKDQQALRGALPSDLPELWRELEERAAPSGRPAIDLARRLLDPDPLRRPPSAGEVAAEASALARACRRGEDQHLVLEELERLAGPAPRSEEVERWLSEQQKVLS